MSSYTHIQLRADHPASIGNGSQASAYLGRDAHRDSSSSVSKSHKEYFERTEDNDGDDPNLLLVYTNKKGKEIPFLSLCLERADTVPVF